MSGYNDDTRHLVVAYALEHGDSAAARHFNLHRGTVARWRKAHETPAAPPAASPSTDATPAASPAAPHDAAPELETLTVKQRRWCIAYLGPAGGNATKAAQMAGYEGDRATLAAIGSENLRKPKIRQALDALMQQELLSEKELLWRTGQVARADLSPYLSNKGVDLDALIEDGHGHLVREMKLNADGSVVFKFHDAEAARARLMRVAGLYRDKLEHSGPGGGPIEVKTPAELFRHHYGVDPHQGPDIEADLSKATSPGQEHDDPPQDAPGRDDDLGDETPDETANNNRATARRRGRLLGRLR